jgi:surfeit locus 1 family protein
VAIDAASAADAAADQLRRRPAWVPTIAAFATIALCLTAASWQHRRMHEKEALQQEISAAASAPAVPLPPTVTDWPRWRFRTVTLKGEFDARHQILIDNVQHAGRVGFGVVTPFVLDDGRTVLIDRGFVAGGATRAILPSPPVPQGAVTLKGRVDLPSLRYVELGPSVLPTGALWQHVDPQKFSQATGIRVLPIVIRSVGPPGEGLVEDDTLPDTGIDKHLSYMMQWLTFAAMAAGLWLWFTVRPWLRHRSTAG